MVVRGPKGMRLLLEQRERRRKGQGRGRIAARIARTPCVALLRRAATHRAARRARRRHGCAAQLSILLRETERLLLVLAEEGGLRAARPRLAPPRLRLELVGGASSNEDEALRRCRGGGALQVARGASRQQRALCALSALSALSALCALRPTAHHRRRRRHGRRHEHAHLPSQEPVAEQVDPRRRRATAVATLAYLAYLDQPGGRLAQRGRRVLAGRHAAPQRGEVARRACSHTVCAQLRHACTMSMYAVSLHGVCSAAACTGQAACPPAAVAACRAPQPRRPPPHASRWAGVAAGRRSGATPCYTSRGSPAPSAARARGAARRHAARRE